MTQLSRHAVIGGPGRKEAEKDQLITVFPHVVDVALKMVARKDQSIIIVMKMYSMTGYQIMIQNTLNFHVAIMEGSTLLHIYLGVIQKITIEV